jgi:formiminotetrahydrofolate cyclodeaminase
MTSVRPLDALSLTDFAARLAARTPTPGGGSLAAFLVAGGAATVSMAYRFTAGEKHAAVEAVMARRAEELDRVRAAALALVQRDAEAYDRVTAAFGMPKGSDAEKAARAAAVQTALKGALEVPYETMELGARALELAAEGAGAVNPNLASDCGAGALAAAAGVEAARANVAINAASIKDAEYVRARREAAEALRRRAHELAEAVRAALAPHLGG